jgi:FkbM family methyltransferase
MLKANILLNNCKNVDLSHLGIALAGRRGRLRGTTPDLDNLGHTVFYEDTAGTVEAVDGDSLLLDEPIEFVKLDVEGMELDILVGLQKTIRRWRPKIFVEVWDGKRDAFLDWCKRESYVIAEQFQRYQGIQNYLLAPQ